MQEQIQQRVADYSASVTMGSWVTVTLSDFNAILETATLTLGLVAGAFSLYFHVRRALRHRKATKDEQQSEMDVD
jgi:hypothetical protein